ncbi:MULTISPECIES: carbohydrate ABC transporter permease [Streptomyces]|uniref:carbohydrate ABC transporter permease n=1 Tax=Streptomyces TaxID=1883 RepID=UPI00167B1219|nr:carbohydrate ABC transporter permease [Streptomyces umbrinus]MCR3728892.1 ABC-type glycerol-3-phosphate transport system permease component [Streptomyces umbrinus]MCX4563112.1 carbohydrate ABC transporter permease [Streptomyces phaeochromogenes]GHB77801.1 ABC transporter permease [Streptomyces umbrinus]GHH64112.1 ABC transporter permease [Streptomyces umbrinus]
MSAQTRPAWMEKPRPLTQAAKAVALVAVVLLVCVPFLVILSTSLASPEEVVDNGGWVLWPTEPTIQAYRDILDGGIVTHALGVSAGVTVVGTLFSLFCTVTLAYALSRPGVFGGRPVLLLVLFTFLFPPGMIPSFLLVKELGLLDSYGSLIFPVLINVFNLVVLRGFFQSIPDELYEAARLDGAGDWRVLWSVVLPLSKAALAVVGLFYAVAYWNSWFYASLYLESDHWPLQQVLRTYVVAGSGLTDTATSEGTVNAPQTVQMAVLVIATVPILLIYPFLQKYFTKGVLTGAIKS